MRLWNRITDVQLALRLEAFGVAQIKGTWCGKTTTVEQQARSIIKLQNPSGDDVHKVFDSTERRHTLYN